MSDNLVEIERSEAVFSSYALDMRCRSCGKGFILWWNGGELDEHRCCEFVYRLEHGRIDLVILVPAPAERGETHHAS